MLRLRDVRRFDALSCVAKFTVPVRADHITSRPPPRTVTLQRVDTISRLVYSARMSGSSDADNGSAPEDRSQPVRPPVRRGHNAPLGYLFFRSSPARLLPQQYN